MSPSPDLEVVCPFPINQLDKFYGWAHGELTLVGDMSRQDFVDHFTMILQKPNLSWGIKLGGELVGVAIVEPCRWPGDQQPTYGVCTIALAPEGRGQKILHTLAPALILQVFNLVPTITRFNAMIPEGNWPERKLAEAMGYKQEGLMREAITIHGQLQNLVVYGLTKKEFYDGLLRWSNNHNNK